MNKYAIKCGNYYFLSGGWSNLRLKSSWSTNINDAYLYNHVGSINRLISAARNHYTSVVPVDFGKEIKIVKIKLIEIEEVLCRKF